MTDGTVYEPRSLKRDRRSIERIAQLEKQILAVLAEDHPQSVRHVFYRMTDPRLLEPVEKSDKGYRHVQQRITGLRRSGQLPYEWITDATRRGFHVNTFDGAADFLLRTNSLYRGDLWRYAGVYLEVWTESRSIAGVIEGICNELAVSLYPAGGFSSITLAYQASEHINERTDDGRIPAVVIYIGDYDPAGVLIDVSIESELRKHLDPRVVLWFKRIAITEEQIRNLDLPEKPRKEGDKRALHVKATVEAEAMPAQYLRNLLRSAIEAHIPENALAVTQAAEECERGLLTGLAQKIIEATHGNEGRDED